MALQHYTIAPTPHRVGRDFVVAHQYARSASNTSVACHGLLDPQGVLVGVALWMPPTKVAAPSVAEDWRGVLALSRLAIRSDVPNGSGIL